MRSAAHTLLRGTGPAVQRSAGTEKNHQRTLPLAPGPPGVNLPSSDIFSPGTGVPDVAGEEAESPLIESSDVAQAESSDATTRNRTAHSVKRSFT